MRRRFVAVVTSIIVVAAGLIGCGDDVDPNVLRVGTEGTYAPFGFRGPDGEFTGYDLEVIETVADRLGKRVEFVQVRNRRALFEELGSRRFDLVADHVAVTLALSEQYEASSFYAVAEQVILTRPGGDVFASLSELHGRNTASWDRSNSSPGTSAAWIGTTMVDSLDQAVRLTEDGAVDATVTDSMAIAEYITRTGDRGLVVTPVPDSAMLQTFVAREGDPVMDEVDRTLAVLRADGTLRAVSEKYFGTDVIPHEE